MYATVPNLRNDLIWSQQKIEDGIIYILKDPRREKYFRMKKEEVFITELMNEETRFSVLRKRIEKHFDAQLSRSTLVDFIKTLDRNGLLDTRRSTETLDRNKNKRASGGLLFYRVKLFNPEKLINRITDRLKFLFSKQFFYFSVVAILAALGILIFNWGQFLNDGSKLLKLSNLPLVILTVFLVGTAHEFAHGMMCRHFGGKVKEMGFLLLYFQPALYCNVSDAWLFSEKSKRLWVAFAGPYFELFLSAMAVLTWRFVSSDSWINQCAILVAATSGIKTLINFIPLIKLDGYYLLSDYLEITNLRSKSFSYLGNIIRRLTGSIGELPKVSAREKKIFILYGILAFTGSVLLFTYISLQISEYLIMEEQKILFISFLILIFIRFRHFFHSLFGKNRKQSGYQSETGKSKKQSGKSMKSNKTQNSNREKNETKRQRFFSKRTTILKSVLAALVALFLFQGQMELIVAGPINVLPNHNADVRSKIDGVVSEVLVHEGELVKSGQVIARLSAGELKSELQQINAMILQKKALLEKLIRGPTENEIHVARLEVKNWNDQYEFATAKRKNMQALFNNQLVARKEFENLFEQEEIAKNRLAEAKGRLKILLDGNRPEEIEAAKAELAVIEEKRRFLEEKLVKTKVTTPASGVVTTPTRHLKKLVNQVVSEGGLIAKVFDLEVIVVKASIPEKEIADVKIGQRIGIKVRAYPDRTFYGKVIEIGTTTEGASLPTDSKENSSATEFSPNKQSTSASISVTSEIKNTEGLLKPGMTGIAKVYCGEHQIIDLVLRRLARTMRVEFWSWW